MPNKQNQRKQDTKFFLFLVMLLFGCFVTTAYAARRFRGMVEVLSGGTLQIEPGATLQVEGGGTLALEGAVTDAAGNAPTEGQALIATAGGTLGYGTAGGGETLDETLTLGSTSTQLMTIGSLANTGTSDFTGLATFNGGLTSPGGVTSEKFGSGSVASGTASVSVGGSADSDSDNCVVIGQGANSTNTGAGTADNNTVVGQGAGPTGAAGISWTGNTAIGQGAGTSTATNTVSVGLGATGSGQGSVSIGVNSAIGASDGIGVGALTSIGAGHTGSIVLGRVATSTAAGQFVVGSSFRAITATFVGEGVTSTTPGAITIQGTRTTTSVSNTAGGTLILASGEGTGNVTNALVFQTPDAEASGSTQQTLATRMTLSESGVDMVGNGTLSGNLVIGGTLSASGGSLTYDGTELNIDGFLTVLNDTSIRSDFEITSGGGFDQTGGGSFSTDALSAEFQAINAADGITGGTLSLSSGSLTYDGSTLDVQGEVNSRNPHAGISLITSTSTSITQGQWIIVAGTTSLGENNLFSMPSNGVVQYDGTDTRSFKVVSCFSSTSSASNTVLFQAIALNGTPRQGSVMQRKIGTGSDVGFMSSCTIVELTTSDQLSIVLDADGATNITAVTYNLHAWPAE